MLQRLVRSMVSTEPRPCSHGAASRGGAGFSSLWARMSRPGKTSSRCLKNAVSMAITSSKWPWIGAILHHQDLAVALDDLGLDLADLLVHQDFDRQLAVEDLLADFGNALGAERIGRARPAQRRLRLLVRLQQRLVGPLRRKRRIGVDAVELVENGPCAFGGNGDCFLNVLDRLMHSRLSCCDGVGPPHRQAKFHTSGHL